MIKLYGFTFLRNGVSHDYSFRESLISLNKLCRKIYIALGKNDDGTSDALNDLDFLEIIPTVWDMSRLGDGGLIFSEQTNIALNTLRRDHCHENGAWGIYLQCDEVIHEDDIEMIVRDLEYADKNGYDAVRFRYLHFWQDHQHIAINKIWYPQEIRALKLDSGVRSYGDAQSFENAQKIFESDARIHHYGHVRDSEKYTIKKDSIIRFIRPKSKLGKYIKREKSSHDKTESLAYLGDHPKVMKDRIIRLKDTWEKEEKSIIWIVGNKNDYSKKIIKKINAKTVNWVQNLNEVPSNEKMNSVIMNPSLVQKILNPSNVPVKMRSKLALLWPSDFFLVLKLSEKGISLKNCND